MNRKAMTIGIASFACIAMVSAGFAAWVITKPTGEAEANGNILVDATSVKEASIETAWKDGKNNIVYGYNTDGVTTNTPWLTNDDPEMLEDLDLTLTVTVNGVSNLQGNLAFTFGENIAFNDAVTAGYVGALPTLGTKTIEELKALDTDSDDNVTFDVDVQFTWGTLFNSENPYKYYNNQTYSDDLANEASERLSGLKNALSNLSYVIKITEVTEAN